MVEGHGPLSGRCQPFPTNLHHPRHDCALVLHHKPGRYPGRCHTSAPQPARPSLIFAGLKHRVMNPAINFNRQLGCRAIEVEYVVACCVLPPELEPAGPLPQFAPQQAFGQRHLTPQLAGLLYRISPSGEMTGCPSTMLRMVPLPRRGRIAMILPDTRRGATRRVVEGHGPLSGPLGVHPARSSSISPAVAFALPTTPGIPAPGWVPAPTR